jgi:hypothetical protein
MEAIEEAQRDFKKAQRKSETFKLDGKRQISSKKWKEGMLFKI